MDDVVEAADFILANVLRLPISKALNPNAKRDFLVISRRLRLAVQGLSARAEADALRDAIEALNVDWENISDSAKDRVVDAARAALAKPGDYVAPKVAEVFVVHGKRIAQDSKAGAKQQYKLQIEPSLTETDNRVIEAVGESQGNFVRNRFGQVSQALSNTAKEVVTAGLEQGLGSQAIRDNIKEELGARAKDQSDAYWGMIAMTFANRARTYGNLSGYSNAGIDWFVFEAVMDERTSQVCEMMHGKRFQVARAINRYQKYERSDDPESIVDQSPWLRADSSRIFWRGSDGRDHRIATIDEGGGFSNVVSNQALERAGITTPPLHGNCRSTIVPDL